MILQRLRASTQPSLYIGLEPLAGWTLSERRVEVGKQGAQAAQRAE
jgi:hypothetical protein